MSKRVQRAGPTLFQAKQPKRNQPQRPLTLSIERFSHDGRGIARHQQQTVFVDGALPGQQVEARITRQARRYLEAQVVKLLQPADGQRKSFCPHQQQCGGCPWQPLSMSDQRQARQQLLEELFAQVPKAVDFHWLEAIESPEQGYRHRTRLHWNHEGVGLRQLRSHERVAMEACPILAAPLERWVQQLAQQLRPIGVPYQIDLAWGDNGLGACVSGAKPLTHTARRDLEAQLSDAVLWGERIGDNPVQWQGEAKALQYPDYWPGLTLEFLPGDFTQVNPSVNRALIERVLQAVAPKPGLRVLDLFAGLGNFALPLAQAGVAVEAFESVAAMVERGEAQAKVQGLALNFHTLDLFAEGIGQQLPDADVLVIDPPRAGADALCRSLADHPAQRIVYVSCQPQTLARDVLSLQQAGFELQALGVVEMFPHAAQSEALAILQRR